MGTYYIPVSRHVIGVRTMELHLEERIHPNLDYYKGENPIDKLHADGWELVQLIPEYDLVECDPPERLAQPGTAKTLKITGKLEVSNYLGLFRR
jgi:hypothetical protein